MNDRTRSAAEGLAPGSAAENSLEGIPSQVNPITTLNNCKPFVEVEQALLAALLKGDRNFEVTCMCPKCGQLAAKQGVAKISTKSFSVSCNKCKATFEDVEELLRQLRNSADEVVEFPSYKLHLMNDEHCKLMVDGKAIVYDMKTWSFSTAGSLKSHKSDEQVMTVVTARGRRVWAERKLPDTWLDWKGVRKYDSAEFRPGEMLGDRVFNLWQAMPVPELGGAWTEVDVEPFLAHVRRILPKPEEAELFLDWLAYRYQNPAARPFAILMVADEVFGVGRSSMGQLLQAIWGRYAGATDAKTLHSPYNGWLFQKLLIVCDEIMTGMSGYRVGMELYDTLKVYIDTSAGKITVNIKYGPQLDAINYAAFLMFTNHADALHLHRKDRRIAVLTNSAVAMTDTEIKDWVAYRKTPHLIEALRAMLLARDVSKFNPSVAPMTEAKWRMIGMTEGDVVKIREAMTAEFADLVTKRQAYAYALQWVRANGSGTEEELEPFLRRDLDRWFKKLEPLNPDDADHGGRINQEPVRCLRNADTWQKTFRPGVANLMHHQELTKNQGVIDAFAKGKTSSVNSDKMS